MIPTTAVEAAARAIFVEAGTARPEGEWERKTESVRTYYRNLAHAALSAAWDHLHPVVTSEAELDALPSGVVVREIKFGLIWERQGDGEGGTFWAAPGDEQDYKIDEITLPATVLWSPR